MKTATTTHIGERRRHQRLHLQIKMQCIRLDPEDGDVVDTLETLDISKSGLGALSNRPYYPGQRLLICMPLSSTSGRRNVYGTVIRCRQVEEGYHLGVQFDSVAMGAFANGPAVAAA
jgi:hypothetical protein